MRFLLETSVTGLAGAQNTITDLVMGHRPIHPHKGGRRHSLSDDARANQPMTNLVDRACHWLAGMVTTGADPLAPVSAIENSSMTMPNVYFD
jgi:hypothetical protein